MTETEQPETNESNGSGGSPAPDAKPKLIPHLVFCGSNKWDLIGRSSVPKAVAQRGGTDAGEELLSPTRFELPNEAGFRPTAVFSGPCAAHLIVVFEDGTACGLGRNDLGQLANADLSSQRTLTRFSLPADNARVILAACGRSHTILLLESGSAYAVGHNASGQLGTGDSHSPHCVAWKRVNIPETEHIISVAAGAQFSIFACRSGTVFACGSGQYGLLGNGRTGESIETGNKIVYDSFSVPIRVNFLRKPPSYQPIGAAEADLSKPVKIKQVAAGSHHVVALDTDGKVWTWGFGGYGRLGHRSATDEMRPRQLETFEAAHFCMDYVSCGATCSFSVQRGRGSTYYWGLTKKTGESNMYPKPIFDLQSNDIHLLSSGATSTVAASERNVVTWGGSPTFGELGYGPGTAKSSSKPRVVEALEGLYCKSAAEGVAFTVLVMEERGGDAGDRKLIEALETRDVLGGDDDEEEQEEEEEEEEASGAKKPGKRGRGRPKSTKPAEDAKRKKVAARGGKAKRRKR